MNNTVNINETSSGARSDAGKSFQQQDSLSILRIYATENEDGSAKLNVEHFKKEYINKFPELKTNLVKVLEDFLKEIKL